MEKLIILFVFIAQVSFGQDLYGHSATTLEYRPLAISSLGYVNKNPNDTYMTYYYSSDSLCANPPDKIITIHWAYSDLNNDQKKQSLAAIEKWILSEKLKLKK